MTNLTTITESDTVETSAPRNPWAEMFLVQRATALTNAVQAAVAAAKVDHLDAAVAAAVTAGAQADMVARLGDDGMWDRPGFDSIAGHAWRLAEEARTTVVARASEHTRWHDYEPEAGQPMSVVAFRLSDATPNMILDAWVHDGEVSWRADMVVYHLEDREIAVRAELRERHDDGSPDRERVVGPETTSGRALSLASRTAEWLDHGMTLDEAYLEAIARHRGMLGNLATDRVSGN